MLSQERVKWSETSLCFAPSGEREPRGKGPQHVYETNLRGKVQACGRRSKLGSGLSHDENVHLRRAAETQIIKVRNAESLCSQSVFAQLYRKRKPAMVVDYHFANSHVAYGGHSRTNSQDISEHHISHDDRFAHVDEEQEREFFEHWHVAYQILNLVCYRWFVMHNHGRCIFHLVQPFSRSWRNELTDNQKIVAHGQWFRSLFHAAFHS